MRKKYQKSKIPTDGASN